MGRIIYPGETAYLRNTGEEVKIITVNEHIKPYRYYFKYEDGSYCYCVRKDLVLRKPKNK